MNESLGAAAAAKAGEPWAVKELLDRTLGKPRPAEGEDGDDGPVVFRVIVPGMVAAGGPDLIDHE
jgi:hypothetical protein